MLPTMNNNNDMLMRFGSILATIMFVKAMYEQYLPYQWREAIHYYLFRYTERVVRFFSPYITITIDEFTGERFNRSQIFTTIETYLSEMTSMEARGLKASFVKDGKALMLGLGDNEEVTDKFRGAKVWWRARKKSSRTQTLSIYPGSDEKRHYQLTFHGRYRDEITGPYLQYVLEQGKAIEIRKRQRKLFTNIKDSESGYNRSKSWTHVEFKHPATFDTLAMEPTKKIRIKNDLVRFKISKNYYAKIGKPWKRGYLLYGPPGTGKSTMIAAMANFLEYDIYDLELTSVKDNTQLRKLLIETSSKSIIVIEDIDCSLDLTGKREEKEKVKNDGEKEEKDPVMKRLKKEEEKKKSEVTLSGLLNFIDGIWSACGEERLIIFTTNYIDKLDSALIRSGRMDMHIELSYCGYEAFRVLAKNYLNCIEHRSFETIKMLLEETKITPADVAENLMPKWLDLKDAASLEKITSVANIDENFMPEILDSDIDTCLENLVRALEKANEDEKTKAEEEERQKQKTRANEEVENKLEEASDTLGEDKKEPKNKAKMEEGSTSKSSVDHEE